MLPKDAGIYLYFDQNDKLLYVGKAKNLKNRVGSYFSGPLLPKTQALVAKIAKIRYLVTASETDALLLEAEVIRALQPRYNSDLKDNKSYIRVKIKDSIIKFVHNETDSKARYFGPYPEGQKVRLLLRRIRKIFPYYSEKHRPGETCFRGHLGLCPCLTGKGNLAPIIKVLRGKRVNLVTEITRDMKKAAANHDYEKALKLKNQIDLLSNLGVPSHAPWEYETNPNLVAEKNLFRVKRLGEVLRLNYRQKFRLEGYDISHIGGTNVVASMVVFTDGVKDPGEYRRFKITLEKNDDPRAMIEVLTRRFKHEDWPKPDLILVDGPVRPYGDCPIIGLEKRLETIVLPDGSKISLPKSDPALQLLMAVRDEAHRFAQSYHHLLRSKKALK